MLCGREKEDLGVVGWMQFGAIGVECARVRQCSKVEAGEVVHGVFSLVMKSLVQNG